MNENFIPYEQFKDLIIPNKTVAKELRVALLQRFNLNSEKYSIKGHPKAIDAILSGGSLLESLKFGVFVWNKEAPNYLPGIDVSEEIIR